MGYVPPPPPPEANEFEESNTFHDQHDGCGLISIALIFAALALIVAIWGVFNGN